MNAILQFSIRITSLPEIVFLRTFRVPFQRESMVFYFRKLQKKRDKTAVTLFRHQTANGYSAACVLWISSIDQYHVTSH